MKRCAKCIMPVNFPMISFDKNGVCSECNTHQKFTVLGEEKLEEILSKHRGDGTKADCIVPFSGGRDSSNALVNIVKKFNMKPILVTYDWGMMSPEAHRNWERTTKVLDIEQIIIKPDLDKTLGHVKKNLLAWSHRPHFGMWPILTMADKQMDYHINKVAQKHNIPLVARGGHNPFERARFKNRIWGIKEGSDKSSTPFTFMGNVRLLSLMTLEYIKNPRYINSSLVEQFKGFYVYLINSFAGDLESIWFYDYRMWNEEEVLSTIRKELDWESPDDTKLTWRTDDYTPPLYNYLAYCMEGYTENDVFRAKQIREGLITREEALKIVAEENKPRWETMLDYFRRLKMSDKEISFVLNSIPKNYEFPDNSGDPPESLKKIGVRV